MTIKQYGGVFGRNPTFNDVTIDGELIINGDTFTGLDYQGAWNASTNTPTLASSTGTLGEFYIVSVAGATDLNGITTWDIGDWALFNGSVWQRVEGGADGNFVNLTATGTVTVPADSISGDAIDGGTPTPAALNINSASSAIRLQTGGVNRWVWEKDATNLGLYRYNAAGAYQGNPLRINNADGSANFEGSVSFNAGSGIDFSATAGTGTSELFDDYEEGVWTPLISQDGDGAVPFTSVTQSGAYTKVGNLVTVTCLYEYSGIGLVGNNFAYMGGLPFTAANNSIYGYGFSFFEQSAFDTKSYSIAALSNAAKAFFQYDNGGGTLYVGTPRMVGNTFPSAATVRFTLTYIAA